MDLNAQRFTWLALQLTLIRVYIGLDFTHHFAEKFGLLGHEARAELVQYFAGLGYAHPAFMMMIGGLCEFGAFVGFTFGLFTRVAAVGTSLYLIICLFSGGHQDNGFTWANAGGGWEFPAMWAFLCLSFVLTGGGKWSADALIRSRLSDKSPKALKLIVA
ncbi:MAG: DoxX family protein [Pseudomonadota bacterium]